MADQEVVASFPPPPAFYKLYKKNAEGNSLGPPPPPPIERVYPMFGNSITPNEVETSLFDADPDRKMDILSGDHQLAFKDVITHLVHSLLFNYVQLLELLATDNPLYESKIRDIETLLLNLHELMNVCRPKEARLEVINHLQEDIARKEEMIQTIKTKVEATQKSMQEALNRFRSAEEEISNSGREEQPNPEPEMMIE